jgi:hypothetical protein
MESPEPTMHIEFEDDEFEGEFMTTVRFVLHESNGPAGAMATFESAYTDLLLEWDDAPFPEDGFDEPTSIFLMGMDALIEAYQAHVAARTR